MKFTRYQIFIVAVLAFLQFTVVLDFMVLSPLGAQLMRLMHITPSQFGLVVSSYAFSAGLSGFLAAGFADKYDRKKMLLFFYSGFIIGTLCCGLANSYELLLAARVFTGIFGGVITSVAFAIITDLFHPGLRGRVMGIVQSAFAASQVLGIPLGLYLAGIFDWHAPFLLITVVAGVILLAIIKYMKPVNHHLTEPQERNAFHHLLFTLSQRIYRRGFLITGILAIGGFMLMPFASAFLVNNTGVTELQLPLVFMITGLFAILIGPVAGKMSDQWGKYKLFIGGTLLTIIMVIVFTHLPITPLWLVITVNSLLFIGITFRMVSYSALITAVPALKERGSFMGINSSLQQLAGGVATFISGLIVVQDTPTSPLRHYNTVGFIVVATMIVSIYLLKGIDLHVKKNAVMVSKTT